MEATGCCHSSVQHLEWGVPRKSPWGVCQQLVRARTRAQNRELGTPPEGLCSAVKAQLGCQVPSKPAASKAMKPCSLKVRKNLGFRGSGRSMLPQRNGEVRGPESCSGASVS